MLGMAAGEVRSESDTTVMLIMEWDDAELAGKGASSVRSVDRFSLFRTHCRNV